MEKYWFLCMAFLVGAIISVGLGATIVGLILIVIAIVFFLLYVKSFDV